MTNNTSIRDHLSIMSDRFRNRYEKLLFLLGLVAFGTVFLFGGPTPTGTPYYVPYNALAAVRFAGITVGIFIITGWIEIILWYKLSHSDSTETDDKNQQTLNEATQNNNSDNQ